MIISLDGSFLYFTRNIKVKLLFFFGMVIF
jgi:hypothetical protein